MKSLFKPIIVAILQWEAKQVLKKYKPHIVAITGSVGKTTTKDAVYTALSSFFFVRKSEKSFNTEIGIPLTILGRPNAWNNPFGWMGNIIEGFALIFLKSHYPKWLVLEVGADRPGDIQKVAGWLNPDIVVVTRIPQVPVHVEFFDSPDAVVEEKSYLVRALKAGGALILDGDDKHAQLFQGMVEGVNIITYGFNTDVAVEASTFQTTYEEEVPTGISFHVDYGGTSVPVKLSNVLGRQHVYATLAAFAVGTAKSLNLVLIRQAFAQHEPAPGRMRILAGINDSIIIDDSYNASPVAVEEALVTMQNISLKGKRIAILGDMMELGSYSVKAHQDIGKKTAESVDLLITVGLRSRATAEAARKAGLKKKQVLSFTDSKEVGKVIRKQISEGDLILIKGSQSVRLERVVEELLANPERDQKLLARQDAEWLKR